MKALSRFFNTTTLLKLLLLSIFIGVLTQLSTGASVDSTTLLGALLGLIAVAILLNHQPEKRVIKPVQFKPFKAEPPSQAAPLNIPVAQTSRSAPPAQPSEAMPKGAAKVAFKPSDDSQTASPDQHLQPSCAFMLNVNSAKPTAYLLPDIASINSFMLMPKELSQFFNANMSNVLVNSGDVKHLRPVDKEYRQRLKKMSLNTIKTPVENGSIILPIHFCSEN